jgi:pyruvate kinase
MTAKVRVDFNARTKEGLVRLDTVGAKKTLPQDVGEGDRVWLTDGEIEVAALLEVHGGVLLAHPDWGTLLKVE